jgi:pimeloyl-ACP methyl ester carboxylesterase
VHGGELSVLHWPADVPDAPLVVLLHDIAADATAWRDVAAALAGPVEVVAPHLRGYGASADLPGPYGVERHAEDVAALLAALRGHDTQAVLAGHGLGAFVATMAATGTARAATRALVLVDGGLELPVPPGADLDDVLRPVLGLDPDAALVPEAVRVDGGDILLNERVLEATTDLPVPATLLWAPGEQDAPGSYDERRLADLGVGEPGSGEAGLTARAVPGTDHDTLLHSPAGVAAVVEAVRDALARTARATS